MKECGICKKDSINNEYNFILQEKSDICKENCVYYNFCSLHCYKETYLYTQNKINEKFKQKLETIIEIS